jgi:hypothetical protein
VRRREKVRRIRKIEEDVRMVRLIASVISEAAPALAPGREPDSFAREVSRIAERMVEAMRREATVIALGHEP